MLELPMPVLYPLLDGEPAEPYLSLWGGQSFWIDIEPGKKV